MEGYCGSFWTNHIGSAHNMQHKLSLKHKRGPLDELHFKDVQSTSIMVGEVEKNSLLPSKKKRPPNQVSLKQSNQEHKI